MAADGISPALAIRSSVGVEVWSTTGQTNSYIPNEQFSKDESKFCRAIAFSPNGRFLAWANGTKVQVCSVGDWKVICSLPRPKAFSVKFSPKGRYLATQELFTTNKDNPDGSPNFYVYNAETGEEMYSMKQKNNSDWEPSWSNDESIFALMIGGEALFFETNGPDGFKKSARKIGGGRNGMLSVAGAGSTPHIAFYTPGVKGAPSICKLFKYPNLEANQAIASKSFFQADRVEMMWNKRGTGMILLTSTDVDQTGNSYYGKQALHFLNTKGDSFGVQLSKEGPIHAVSWSPKSTEFCVIYGYMPSKATFFNLKCDPVFEVGESPRNSIYYNDFGNLVLLAGFGNLRGNVEVWDANEKKLLITLQAPDSTLLEWCPDGELFLTATTAPRLRMSNGFKVWHYSGALLHETSWAEGQELLEVVWQKYAEGEYKEKPISNVKIQGIQSSQPQASKAVYVPPNARGGGVLFASRSAESEKGPIPGLPIGYKVSQNQLKKNRNTRRKNNEKPDGANTTTTNGGNNNNVTDRQSPTTKRNPSRDFQKQNNQNQQQQSQQQPLQQSDDNSGNNYDKGPARRRPNKRNNRNSQGYVAVLTGDPEKDKRIKVIHNKLQDISRLKTRRDKGENLEANQVSKINLEKELQTELDGLKITT